MSPLACPARLDAARAPAPLRWRPAALALLLALALHALMLGVVPIGAGPGRDDTPRAALQTRRIERPVPASDTAPVAAETRPSRPNRPPRAVPRLSTAPPAEPVAVAALTPLSATRSSPTPPDTEPEFEAPAPVPGMEAAGETRPASPVAAGVDVPVFPTRMPSAAALTYELRRGGLVGQGDMIWRPQGASYQLSLRGGAFGLTLVAWASQGGFDDAGIAPERFVDRRQSRNPRAANFQRAAGRISFSGPAIEYPLVPGAQDRLSWMLQLPAILQAAATPPLPGARYPIFVVGARGDADVWTFVVEGSEAVELAAGSTAGAAGAAVRLLREPRRPFDTRVEVWLDPERQHLPVRVRLTQTGNGEVSEFLLRELRWLPEGS